MKFSSLIFLAAVGGNVNAFAPGPVHVSVSKSTISPHVPSSSSSSSSSSSLLLLLHMNKNSNNDEEVLQGGIRITSTSTSTFPSLNFNLQSMQKSITAFALACTLFTSPSPMFLNTASAADYAALTDEQKAVAEAWRIVDNNFFDRTFNNQDWFKVRQDSVKKKYKNMGEAQIEIEKIVGSLGDKYTRYLPPAKYRSIVDAATGTLAGVGVEISTDKDTGKIYVSDTEPSSPASNGTLYNKQRKKEGSSFCIFSCLNLHLYLHLLSCVTYILTIPSIKSCFFFETFKKVAFKRVIYSWR